MPVGAALAMLKFTPQAAAPHLAKLLRSAVANAENKGGRVDVGRAVREDAHRGPRPQDAPLHAARHGPGHPDRQEDEPRLRGTRHRGARVSAP